MKKLFTLLILLLFLAGSSWGQFGLSTKSHLPEKKVEIKQKKVVPNPPVPLGILQGGDVIATATVISSLPYNDNGTTTGYTNNYDEVCDYTGSIAPDVVYGFTPAENMAIDVDLCGTSYDSKLYVYENDETNLVACNDDFYLDDICGYYTSALFAVNLTVGNTYYIIVDGYGESSGNYILNVSQVFPCVWGTDADCPTGAVPESEPCGQDLNGGCNMEPGTRTWEPVPETGITVCGTMWADDASGGRDTDWFELILTQNSIVTLTADADRLIIYGLIAGGTAGYIGNPDCITVEEILPNSYAGPCDQSSLNLGVMNPGTYWFFAGMTVYDGFPCQNNYWIEFDITPVFCLPPVSLLATDVTMTTANLTWQPGGTETNWEYVYGLAPLPVPVGSGTPTTSNTLNPIESLTPNSSYQFYVRSDCNGNIGPWAGPVDFNTLLCDPSVQCNYTFRMTDSYGDGWNSNTMSVIQEGFTVQTLSLLDGTGPEDVLVALCQDYNFELFWNLGGSWPEEVGIEIIDPFGHSIYNKPPETGSQGTSLYVGMTNCAPPVCQAPTDLAVSIITENSATLSWNGPIDSFFDVFFGPGSDPFTGTVLSTVSSPLTVDDLEQGADYGFYVRTDCGFDTPKTDYFWMAMDAPGNLVPPLSGGTVDEPGEDGIWYLYNQAPGDADWWNIWFYNDPVDTTRMKKIRMGFWIQSFDNLNQGMLNYVINWSDTAWDGPGFPAPLNEAFIHRSPVNGPLPVLPGAPMWIELYYIIPHYNPEWVSVDIWGENIQILQVAPQAPPAGSPLAQYWMPGSPGGIIVHECLPKNSGPTSTWSGPLIFTTLCPVYNLPLCESFDPPSANIPNCWTEQLEGEITTPHWSVVATDFAGGDPNEAVAGWSPIQGVTQADNDRLVTPMLNTNGMTSINLSFKHYLDDYNAGVNDVWVKVQSSSDGLTWTDEWVYPAGLSDDILTENKNLVLTNNVGSTTYIAWTLSGYTYNIDSWRIDDICIYESCMANTWTGAVSVQWNNPDNWSCGILPNNLTTVQIPAGLSFYPIVPAGITAYCYQVELATGATLMVESGGILNVVNP